jgi:lipopolysaccharide biosynthesis protein
MADHPIAPIAVFVHVHYPDVWKWMAAWIAKTLRRPFHLVLTTSKDDASLILPDTPFLLSHQIVRSQNRGRDILPFLGALGRIEEGTIGLKLHTKQSTHRLDGANWGEMLVHALLPDAVTVDRMVEAMEADPRLGLVGPDGMLVSLAPWIQHNAKLMRQMAKRLGLPYAEAMRRTPVFSATSMFWFQRSALSPLVTAELDDLFEPERGQVDGTAAHALERWFSLLVEADGRVVTTVKGVGLSRPDMNITQLRTISRQLADQPNDFLVPLGRYARLLLRVPGLRAFYQSMPTWVRRGSRVLRRFDRP